MTSTTPEPASSPLRTLLDVFVAPVRAMRQVERRPALALPLAVALGIALIVGIAVAPTALESLVDHIHESSDLDAAQRDDVVRFIEENEPLATGLLATGGALNMLLTVLLWSALLHAGSSLTFAERPEGFSFALTASVVAHANLVNVPLFVIQALLLAAGIDATLTVTGLLGLDPQTPLGTALAWIGPFNLWWLVLLGIGVAVLFDTRFGRALWIPLAISLGLRILQVAFAALTGGAPA
jgi:hypothetical protein